MPREQARLVVARCDLVDGSLHTAAGQPDLRRIEVPLRVEREAGRRAGDLAPGGRRWHRSVGRDSSGDVNPHDCGIAGKTYVRVIVAKCEPDGELVLARVESYGRWGLSLWRLSARGGIAQGAAERTGRGSGQKHRRGGEG